MAAFGAASAKSPRCVEGRREEATLAREALQKAMGPAAVVDAAAVAAQFHAVSKAVDSAGHSSPMQDSVLGVLEPMLFVKNWIISLVMWLLGPIMPSRK